MRRILAHARVAVWMLMALWACGDGGPSEPRAGPPARIDVVAGANQTGTVGTALPIPPVVRVTDAAGLAARGSVTFQVQNGGSVSIPSSSTDADGRASAGVWTLGTTAGQQTLQVSVAGGPTTTITATATAGAAASMTVQAGNAQTGLAGTAVAVAPAVRLTDQHGNPVSGAPVTFAVTSGGGSVSGSTVQTNAEGVAAVGSWTLGPAAGAQTLQATSGSLAPVTFTATATDPCAQRTALPVGTSVVGTLTASDCQQSNRYRDFYSFSVTQQTALTMTMTPTNYAGYGAVYTQSGDLVIARSGATGAAITNHMVLPAGDYVMHVAGNTAADLGAYTLSLMPGAASGCTLAVGTMLGTTVSGSVTASDCVSPISATSRYDYYAVYLPAGTTVSAQATAQFPLVFELYAGGSPVAFQNASNGAAGLTYTTTAAGFHYFYVVAVNNSTGSYSMSVSAGGDACAQTAALAPGGWLAGDLSLNCTSNGVAAAYVGLTVPTQQIVEVNLSPNTTLGPSIRTAAYVYRGSDFVVAYSMPDATTARTFRMLLPPGGYTVRTQAATAGETGGYSLSAGSAGTDVGCSAIITVPGISTSQQITTADCVSTVTGDSYYDELLVWMVAGRTYTISYTSSVPMLSEVWTTAGRQTGTVGFATSGSYTFTPTANGYYGVNVVGPPKKGTGSYTLSIQ